MYSLLRLLTLADLALLPSTVMRCSFCFRMLASFPATLVFKPLQMDLMFLAGVCIPPYEVSGLDGPVLTDALIMADLLDLAEADPTLGIIFGSLPPVS